MAKSIKGAMWLVGAFALLGTPSIWAQQTAADVTIPPKRAHHAMVYDATRKEVVLYGGSTAAGNNTYTTFDDLWSWNGRRWKRLATTDIPRSSHQLSYDPVRRQLLLIGGMNGQQRFGEIRAFDGKAWQLMNENPALALVDAAVVYDTHRQRLVFFGGLKADRTASGETWEFDGNHWQRVATTGPGPLHSTAMIYDEANKVTLLFGGMDEKGARNGQTWQWDGTRWKQLAVTGPPARASAGFAYDVKRKQALLFGGIGEIFLGDTWIWDGKAWREVHVPGPSARALLQMTYDRQRAVVVLFGGRVKYPEDSNETWEWNGKNWSQLK